jgi:hypothetical protein
MEGGQMGMAEDGMMTVRARLLDQIERLETELPALSPCEIVERVDTVRRTARDHGLGPLADMAHGLESIMAWGSSRETIQTWVAALKEAVGCETLDHAASRTWLAALGLRTGH